MSLWCKILNHKYVVTEHIKYDLSEDFHMKCSRCPKRRTVMKYLGFIDGWVTKYGTKFRIYERDQT